MIFVSVVNLIGVSVIQSQSVNAFLSVIGRPALLSLLGSRLLFNMKEAGAKGLNGGTGFGWNSTMTGIDFAGPSSTITDESELETRADIRG